MSPVCVADPIIQGLKGFARCTTEVAFIERQLHTACLDLLHLLMVAARCSNFFSTLAPGTMNYNSYILVNTPSRHLSTRDHSDLNTLVTSTRIGRINMSCARAP